LYRKVVFEVAQKFLLQNQSPRYSLGAHSRGFGCYPFQKTVSRKADINFSGKQNAQALLIQSYTSFPTSIFIALFPSGMLERFSLHVEAN
jgi:hypothetical protein